MCNYNIFTLTEEEEKRGLETIRQLERGVNERLSAEDLMFSLLLPWYIFKCDWNSYNLLEKIGFVLFWWPLYHLIYLIIC